MRSTAADHDRVPEAPDPDTTLKLTLDRIHLEGAVFRRAQYREPWTYESLTGPVTANMLRPGTDRVVVFHLVASGTCWVAVPGGPKHWASAGDVIVLPYGDQHWMGGVTDAELVRIEDLGDEGALTGLVCGYLHSRDPLFEPSLRALAPLFVVSPPPGAGAEWVRANIEYAIAHSEPSSFRVPTRLPELLLVEVLRLHLASAPAVDSGWAAALRDPVLVPALAAMHTDPARKWTVTELATVALVSRSALDARFREVLGRSPIRYLTQWRMHVAQDLLATTDLGVVGVAHRVGYDAEEAFSRAFKRYYGSSPTSWRAESQAPSSTR
ncbi:AraC family transcriptional regulator [Cellulomonas sp. URHD0024]|uniref:AraC family transcriptional regulator n=1 Tax=Cellulomonas sp. URHD0024 TaxID=1302620 RepID=UPI000424ACAB|nr:AraC family transcriptional regulator [Cellulomonas sp. URHD0024]